MSKKIIKKITLYDTEKRMNGKTGFSTKSIDITGLTPAQIEDKIVTVREEQKKRNLQIRENQKIENEEKAKVMSGEKMPFEVNVKMVNLPIAKSTVDLILDEHTGNSTILLGASKMGKSTLLMHLYDKYYNKKDIISALFTINPHIGLYKNHKNLIICETFNKKSELLIKEEKYINVKTNNHYSFCNILDDIIDIRYSMLLNNMIMTYRNSNMSSLISIQSPKLLNKNARGNVNNIFLFNFISDEMCLDAVKLYCRNFFNKMGYRGDEEQVKLYRELTKNHGFIYINIINNHISFHRLNI